MSNDTNVMIDLETWGTGNNAVIISLGAVKFSADLGIFDRFHIGIDPQSCIDAQLKMDVGTIMWWMQPERDEARKAWLALPKLELFETLDGFAQWYGAESLPTWGNGATFDNVILRNAYASIAERCPWHFWHDRCYRTMKAVHPIPEEPRSGTHHNALDDAVHQAGHLIRIWGMM